MKPRIKFSKGTWWCYAQPYLGHGNSPHASYESYVFNRNRWNDGIRVTYVGY